MTYRAPHRAIILNITRNLQNNTMIRLSRVILSLLHLSISLFHPFPRLQHWYNFLIPRLLNPWILVRWVSQIQARKKPQLLTALQHEMPCDPSIWFHWHRFDQAISLTDHWGMKDSSVWRTQATKERWLLNAICSWWLEHLIVDLITKTITANCLQSQCTNRSWVHHE